MMYEYAVKLFDTISIRFCLRTLNIKYKQIKCWFS